MLQTGAVVFDDKTTGWTLHAGTGDRTFVSPDIPFQPPFGIPPQIALALSGVDGDRDTNLRVNLSTSDVEPGEFNIVVRVWADTVLYGVQVTWIAFDR